MFILFYLFLFQAKSESYYQWKSQFVDKAVRSGLNRQFVLKNLQKATLLPEVLEKDRNQVIANPNIVFPNWIKKWLRSDDERVTRGKKLLSKYNKELDVVEKKYGVDKEVIVALWGVETFYGDIMGDYPIVSSLLTLAYDKRRRSFFEKELISALHVLKLGWVSFENYKGSWAGASGQCQFMPSNIWAFSQDYNGDKVRDIWFNRLDVFASIANYLKKAGWKFGLGIGTLVNLDKNPGKSARTPAEWINFGAKGYRGVQLGGNWRRSAQKLPFKNSPYILRGSNYNVILKWNNSPLFVAFVELLANEFRGK